MSIGNSLSGITFAGLSSGIDTDSIISRLLQLEVAPIQRLQAQQNQISTRIDALGQLKGRLTSLSSIAGALNTASAFNQVSVTSSAPEVASVSISGEALPSLFNLTVSKLAQAHKIGSTAQASVSEALNLAGTFVVNGKSVTVSSTDTLTSVAQKINGTNSGVTASVLNGGAGNSYISISANGTGAQSKIQLADLTGSIVQTLGLVTGAATPRESITNGYTSAGFKSSTEKLSTVWAVSGLGTKNFEINGVAVSIDPDNQNLQEIANAINAAGTGANATVRTVTENNVTSYRLDLTGATTFTDTDGILTAMGVLQRDYGSQLVAAQDSAYTLDGISMTSKSNTVTTAIPGVTFTLLKANETTPEKSTITVKGDKEAVKSKIKQFGDAVNAVNDFIKSASAFDKDTFATGPLFGDNVARQIEGQIGTMLFNNVPGLTGNYTNLAALGFSYNTDGKMVVDDAQLSKALDEDPSAVNKIFRAMGSTSSDQLSFISSTDKTIGSGGGVYQVNITQLAAQSAYKSEMVQTQVSTGTEKLTFSGALFGNTNYDVIVAIGNNVDATISQLNNDAKLKDLIVASKDVDGSLVITTKKYGSNTNFTVVSDKAAATDNSGIGTSSAGTYTTGVDVAGTINGELATGAGQFLTGKSGNANTDGLQVRYTGNTLGLIGNVTLTRGIGAQMQSLIGTYTDITSGLMSTNDKELQAQIDSIEERIKRIQDSANSHATELRTKFAAMEQAISSMQQQQSQLAAMMRR
ncbi:MAG: flagellar filament capping protein FliD [Fimbriimonadaceae bacterium]|nr:flagellar filament capping protein FliD [Fimbriimonadaceae bacterium]